MSRPTAGPGAAGGVCAYLDTGGDRLPAEEVERVKALEIPPAWQ